MKKLFFLTLLVQFYQFANAQNSIPDSLFGINSLLQVSTVGGETGSNFMMQPNGKIVFGGYDYDINQNDFHINMMRFDECGLLDSSFGLNGLVRHKFSQRNIGNAYKLQPDGKIVVAGLQAPSNSGSQQIPFVGRYNSNGTPDTTFNLTGSNAIRFDATSSGTFNSNGILPDGKIVCMGNSNGNINGGTYGVGAMRFLADGTVDSTFNSDGKTRFSSPLFPFYGSATGHLLQNGNIIVTTIALNTGFNERFLAVQFDSLGNHDTSYGSGGIFTDTFNIVSHNFITASALYPNNKILIAANQAGDNSFNVIRLTASGQLDLTFGIGGHVNYILPGAIAKKISLLSNGRILIHGSYSMGFGTGFGVMMLSDGTIDSTFGVNGFRIFDLNNNLGTHSFDALFELSNGKWIVAGSASDFLFKKYADLSNVPHISQSVSVLSTTGTGSFQWYLNSAPIPSATQSTYSFTQNGIYTVMITNSEGCTYLSDPYSVNNVSVPEINNLPFIIYPNPFSDELQIMNNNVQFNFQTEVILYDVAGKQILKTFFNAGDVQFKLNTSIISNGMYHLQFKTNNGVFSKRIVKN